MIGFAGLCRIFSLTRFIGIEADTNYVDNEIEVTVDVD
jgi:hypothetical protein